MPFTKNGFVKNRLPGPPRHIKDLIPDPRGWVLRISSDGYDQMGAKIMTPKNFLGHTTKPQKIPGPGLQITVSHRTLAK